MADIASPPTHLLDRAGLTSFSGKPTETATLPTGAIVNARYADMLRASAGRRIMDVCEGIWVIRNYAIVNCIVVEVDRGLVLFDTGTNVGEGEIFRQVIRERTDAPIIAIIYSHSHYTGGASALLADSPDAITIGHPKLEANFLAGSLDLRPSRDRRLRMQFGAFLPDDGPDARLSPPILKAADPARFAHGHVPVVKAVADGEVMTIGGTAFEFYHAVGDTDDTLTVYLPDRDTVVTNVVSRQFFAMSTLRGERYREPPGIIASYDKIRAIAPEHYVQMHGDHVSGRDEVTRIMQIQRDAYSFTYNQAIRGINQGWSPDEIVLRTRLPATLRDDPSLFEGYSEFAFALRGIYAGLIGWYAEDAADMHPPSPARLGRAIVDGFGGSPALLKVALEAIDRREFDLAAKLAGFAVQADSSDMEARRVKAIALREMARVSTGLQAHNFYLVEALELEGKIDTRQSNDGFFGEVTFGSVDLAPPISLVDVLETRIIPRRSAGVQQSVDVYFSDIDERFRIDIRDSVAEVRQASDPSGAPTIETDRSTWFGIIEQTRPVSAVMDDGRCRLIGIDLCEVETFLAMFDPV